MRITCDPPIGTWRPAADRGEEGQALLRLAGSEGGHRPALVMASGHQPWMWHPGILAKDLALVAAARQHTATPVHLVVDHDTQVPLQLSVPVVHNGRLKSFTLTLGPHDTHLPAASQGPLSAEEVAQRLRRSRDRLGRFLRADLNPLISAFEGLPVYRSLAEQISAVIARLAQPWVGSLSLVYSSDLARLPLFADLLQQIVADAPSCAEHYNRAVAEFPVADVAPLRVGPSRVELPLWLLQWQRPRRRVYADISRGQPRLVDDEDLELGADRHLQLAPKALLLSALMRCSCGLFIHGRGGALYEPATEKWWQDWLGRPLAPMAVVSADLHLPLAVPLSDEASVARAIWWQHHLPANVDRAFGLSGEPARQKQQFIERMREDRDRQRRAQAFAQIHRINDELARRHEHAVRDAQKQVMRSGIGLENHRLASRRDWCFALYQKPQLALLTEAFTQ